MTVSLGLFAARMLSFLQPGRLFFFFFSRSVPLHGSCLYLVTASDRRGKSSLGSLRPPPAKNPSPVHIVSDTFVVRAHSFVCLGCTADD